MSRADIARRSGLSEGTVSRIVAKLIEQKLVSEEGAENSTGGRPATRLQLSEWPRAIGVEVQNWETRLAVSTLEGTLTDRTSIRTPATPQQTVERIAEQVGRLSSLYGTKRIHGLGVCARGIVNSHSGVVEMGNSPGWVNVPLRQMLEDAVRMPVYLDNDVRAATMAEYSYTPAGDHAPHCLLYVRVDEGVGVGLILNGELYAGPSMSAGEFGQMVIAEAGGELRHDRPGSWEQLVSNSAVCQRYDAARGRTSVTTTSDTAAKVRKICQLAVHGDDVAAGVLQDIARYMGIGIANLAWGLNPEVVVVSSTLNAAWPLLADAIRSQFPNPGEWPSFRNLHVQRSALEDQGVLVGAATLAFSSVFRPE
ncbi:MAG: ROK family transcriptional regulator [Acidobacteria bacterium]|nr:ROK family transcriptional regulator [Acidobacteriota bacterium]